MSVRKSSLSTILAFSIVKFLAVARDFLVIGFFGLGLQTDAYFVSFFVPLVFFGIISIGLSTVLMPLWTGHEADGSLSDFLGKIITIIFVFSVLMCAATYAASDLLATMLAPGFTLSGQYLTSRFLSVQAISIVGILLTGVLKSFLQYRNKFFLSEVSGIFPSIGIISTIPFVTSDGLLLSLTGFVCGLTLQVILLFFLVLRTQKMRISIFPDRELYSIFYKIPPFFIGVGGGILATYGLQVIASYLEEGAISSYSIALKIVSVPVEIIAGALSTVIYPQFSSLIIKKEDERLRSMYKKGAYLSAFLLSPFFCILFLYSGELLGLIRTVYAVKNIEKVLAVLPVLSLSLVLQPNIYLLTRVIYAHGRTWTPAFIGVITAVVSMGTAYSLSKLLGLVGFVTGQMIGMGSSLILLTFLTERLVSLRITIPFLMRYVLLFVVPLTLLYMIGRLFSSITLSPSIPVILGVAGVVIVLYIMIVFYLIKTRGSLLS